MLKFLGMMCLIPTIYFQMVTHMCVVGWAWRERAGRERKENT